MIKNFDEINEVIFILDNIRLEDKQELMCLYGNNWYEKILADLKQEKFYIMYGKNNDNKEVPIAMGGFKNFSYDDNLIAAVWLLSSKDLSLNKKLFFKELKQQVMIEEKQYDILFNFIYKSNFTAKKWLKNLGFLFDNPKPKNLNVPENFEFFYKIIK